MSDTAEFRAGAMEEAADEAPVRKLAQRDGAIGLLLLLVWWSYQADPLELGWAAVWASARAAPAGDGVRRGPLRMESS